MVVLDQDFFGLGRVVGREDVALSQCRQSSAQDRRVGGDLFVARHQRIVGKTGRRPQVVADREQPELGPSQFGGDVVDAAEHGRVSDPLGLQRLVCRSVEDYLAEHGAGHAHLLENGVDDGLVARYPEAAVQFAAQLRRAGVRRRLQDGQLYGVLLGQARHRPVLEPRSAVGGDAGRVREGEVGLARFDQGLPRGAAIRDYDRLNALPGEVPIVDRHVDAEEIDVGRPVQGDPQRLQAARHRRRAYYRRGKSKTDDEGRRSSPSGQWEHWFAVLVCAGDLL